MTTIRFQRSGGVTGREVSTSIDLSELPGAEMQELMHLVTEAKFFDIPENLISTAMPDEHEYTITVDGGNTHHTVHTSDATAPESLRPLLEKLTSLAQLGNSKTLR